MCTPHACIAHPACPLRPDLQPGEDNHDIALEFVMQNLYYHNYADAKEAEVDDYYAG